MHRPSICYLFRIVKFGAQEDLHYNQTALGTRERGASILDYEPAAL